MTTTERIRNHPTLLTVPQAAELIQCDKLTLYTKIKTKKFPVIRIGDASIRIDPVTLADWLDKRTA
jgi:excisionase family DNA binding protein